MTPSLTAIVIARNEESMIANCLETLRWCDEIIVINNDSSDATVSIAHRSGARVITLSGGFAELRTEGLKRAKTDWLLYIDADERVTPALAAEIRETIGMPAHPAYAIGRTNVLYGQHMQHGGWNQDQVVRLFNRATLQGWDGEIHEHAVVTGSTGELQQSLIHFTHRDVISGLKKTIEWTPIEATLLANSKIPPVTLWTLLRKGGMEVFRRAIREKGYKDGLAGWIEALIQGMNRMLVYIQVWELQQKPSLSEQYQHHETAIARLWKNAK
ncbi:MAG TPA: glycosyltransferase family 2 protein [Vitreimonas sp.]|nr:glycosyltransferase family 2 protein [Vitreimonas sp.]